NRGFRANQPVSVTAERHAEAHGELHVVLRLLRFGEGRALYGILESRAVDVVVGGHVEVEQAAEMEAERGADHRSDVILVAGPLVGIAAAPDVAAAAVQAQPDR